MSTTVGAAAREAQIVYRKQTNPRPQMLNMMEDTKVDQKL